MKAKLNGVKIIFWDTWNKYIQFFLLVWTILSFQQQHKHNIKKNDVQHGLLWNIEMPSGDIPVLANLSVNSALENKNKRQKNATCCFYYFMLKVNLCRYAAYISYDIAWTTRHAFLVGIRNRCKSKYIFVFWNLISLFKIILWILHSIRLA